MTELEEYEQIARALDETDPDLADEFRMVVGLRIQDDE